MKKIDFAGFPLSRRWLISVRVRALRCGVWYSVLTRTERACVDLVVRVVERVSSRLLGSVLSSILRKLFAAMESPVLRLMCELGGKLASEVSQIAKRWGNTSAVEWAGDFGFVQYLTVMHLNTRSCSF